MLSRTRERGEKRASVGEAKPPASLVKLRLKHALLWCDHPAGAGEGGSCARNSSRRRSQRPPEAATATPAPGSAEGAASPAERGRTSPPLPPRGSPGAEAVPARRPGSAGWGSSRPPTPAGPLTGAALAAARTPERRASAAPAGPPGLPTKPRRPSRTGRGPALRPHSPAGTRPRLPARRYRPPAPPRPYLTGGGGGETERNGPGRAAASPAPPRKGPAPLRAPAYPEAHTPPGSRDSPSLRGRLVHSRTCVKQRGCRPPLGQLARAHCLLARARAGRGRAGRASVRSARGGAHAALRGGAGPRPPPGLAGVLSSPGPGNPAGAW